MLNLSFRLDSVKTWFGRIGYVLAIGHLMLEPDRLRELRIRSKYTLIGMGVMTGLSFTRWQARPFIYGVSHH